MLVTTDWEYKYPLASVRALERTEALPDHAPSSNTPKFKFETSGGSVAIKINDDVGNYFHTNKGLRQGDTISPMLFNITADMLAILVERAKMTDQINCVIPH